MGEDGLQEIGNSDGESEKGIMRSEGGLTANRGVLSREDTNILAPRLVFFASFFLPASTFALTFDFSLR